MDFGPGGRYESLDPGLLPPLVVAWRGETSADSGIVHGDLRSRFDAGEEVVTRAMSRLAQLAREARAALLAGDRAAFAASVDASFDARAQMMELDVRHVAMIDRAEVTAALREIGCGTAPTGASGGAAKPGA